MESKSIVLFLRFSFFCLFSLGFNPLPGVIIHEGYGLEGKSRENGNIGNLSKGLKSSAKEGITTERVHIGGNLFVVVWYGEFVAGTKPFMFHHW